MKKRLVVHIGVHKTGSTAVQQTLVDNAEQLLQYGILYPRHYAARPEAINHNHMVWEIEHDTADFAQLRAWAQSLAQSAAHTVIISAEDLCRLKNLDFLNCFTDLFDIEVVVYLRRQDSWISSWYNQHMKWPYISKLARCTPMEFLGHLQDFHWINYFETIERWVAVAGAQRMHIRVLEKGQIEDPVADMCDLCGVDFVLDKVLTTRINESLPTAHIRILRSLGMLNYAPDLRWSIIEALRRIPVPPERDVYPREVCRMVLGRYIVGNGKVAEHYLGRKDRVLFRDGSFPEGPVHRIGPADEEQLFQFARHLIDVFSATGSANAPASDAG